LPAAQLQPQLFLSQGKQQEDRKGEREGEEKDTAAKLKHSDGFYEGAKRSPDGARIGRGPSSIDGLQPKESGKKRRGDDPASSKRGSALI